MLPSLLLALFSILSVAAADCTSFLPSGGIPINDLNADLKLSESPVAFFDISPSLASFAGQHFEWREESPPTVTTHRHVWGSCEKGGMSRDGTVEAGEQCPEDTLLCRTSSNTRPAHRLEPSRITSVIPILSLSHPLHDARYKADGMLMPYSEKTESGGWEPKGWRAIQVGLVGETYVGRKQEVMLLYQCVEGQDSKLAYLSTFDSLHAFTVTGKDGCVEWAREKKQEEAGGGGGGGAQPVEEQPPQQDTKRPSMPERARGIIWWISGFGFILLASILLLLIHRGRVSGTHNIFRRRSAEPYHPFHPSSSSSPRQSRFPRVQYVDVMFDADQEEAAAAVGRRREGPSQKTPLLG